MKTRAIIAQTILAVTLWALPASAGLNAPEKLVWDVHWKGVAAGTAEQEVTPHGQELTIVNTIKSGWFVSAFFSIDDKTESVILRDPAEHQRPKSYKENINEGKYHTRKEARFNFDKMTVESKDLMNKTEKSDHISDRTYDSLSSIYFIRSSELTPGQVIHFNIYDFKHLWSTEVRVVKREEVTVPAGTFKTIKVTSQLTYNGIPSKVGNATFWFTDDSRRIPVKISTKLKVGETTMALTGGTY